MLTINLEQIVADINSRRNRVRYPFQELALMLTQKLADPRHKSLYMKIAKYEEQELIMDALHYVTAGNLSGNLGAIFMWKIKELKSRPILPVALRFENEAGHFKIGTVSEAIRGDMPLLVAALNIYNEAYAPQLLIESWKSYAPDKVSPHTMPFLDLPRELKEMLVSFDRSVRLTIMTSWSWHATDKVQPAPTTFTGILKIGVPQLTKREVGRRMRLR